jgi:hypothetical protein
LLGGYFVVVGGRSTLSMHAFLLLIDLLGVRLGLLGVLLGERAVLGRLAPMRINRSAQLLSLCSVSVCLLTMTGCLGGKALSLKSSPLRPTSGIDHGHGESDDRDDGYGYDENR